MQIGTGASLANSGSLTINSGTFDLNGNDQTIGDLSGTGGAVTLNGGALTFGTADSTIYFGGLVGPGGLTKNGSGTFTLVGNDQATATFIGGGALQIGDGGTSGSVVGAITDNSLLAIDRSDTVTWSTAVSGTGAFAQIGSGTTILTAADSYTGGTTVDAGILQIGTGASLASGGSLTINSGAFDLNGNDQTIGDLSGTGGAVTLNGGALTFGTADSTIYFGGLVGPGGLTKNGSGTFTLVGNDQATATFIVGGALQIGNGGGSGSLSGDVLDEATLTIDRSGAVTLSGTISGGGSLDQIGSGTVFITANDNYSGGTTISAGTLQLGDGSSDGSITGIILDNATFADDDSGSNTLSGAISGGGAFDQIGSGTTILTAVDSVSGGTTIAAGTLKLGSGGAITGDVTLTGADATLALETGINQIGGDIVGAATGDAIDLGFETFAAGDHAVWQQTTASAGTLTLEAANDTTLATFNLTGHYVSGEFKVIADSQNDAQIDVVKPNVVEDFNNDGISDLLWRNTSGVNAVWEMNGQNIESYFNIPSVDPSYKLAGTGDFNGDGNLDLLWRNTSGTNAVWLMDGHGNIESYYNLPSVDPSYVLATVGDFNGDGISDLLWRDTTTGVNAVWEMNSSGNIESYFNIPTIDPSYMLAGTGDFNGDGITDLIWRNPTTGVNTVWDMNANGSIESSFNLPTVDPDYILAGTGDFNGDGITDLLWRNTVTGVNAVWEMNANGSIQSYFNLPTVDPSYQVAQIADFNGDGFADILWRQSSTGVNAVWEMNGSGIQSYFNIPTVDPSYQAVGTQHNVI